MKLSINTRAVSQREVLLTLIGEIDYASAQQLRTAIMSALANEIDTITVSLAGVTFVDSIGVGTLVVARRICNDLRVTLRVRDANPAVARLFTVIGAAQVLGLPEATAPVPDRLPRPRLRPTVTTAPTTSLNSDQPADPESTAPPGIHGRNAAVAWTNRSPADLPPSRTPTHAR